MAVTYGFYDSLNHDRLYNAQQMSAIFDGIINDGVFMSVGNQFHTVAGTGMQVIVKSGRAWFDSTWTLNDAEYPLSIDAADVLLTRIDAVVLEVNSEVATRANTIKVVKGTPASTPAKPTLTNTAAVHQHALAYVTVAKNTAAITNSMIEIVVGKTETPYVTAILQTTDITDLFNQWEDYFQTWFDNVRSTLDGDVALNLQNQITTLERSILKGDTKTAMGLPSSAVGDDAFNYLLNEQNKNYDIPYYPELIVIQESGDFTIPTNINRNYIDVIAIGGGGGAGGSYNITNNATNNANGGGGGGGYVVEKRITVTPNEILKVEIGASGESGRHSSSLDSLIDGTAGGNTIIHRNNNEVILTANGGSPGTRVTKSGYGGNGGNGGSGGGGGGGGKVGGNGGIGYTGGGGGGGGATARGTPGHGGSGKYGGGGNGSRIPFPGNTGELGGNGGNANTPAQDGSYINVYANILDFFMGQGSSIHFLSKAGTNRTDDTYGFGGGGGYASSGGNGGSGISDRGIYGPGGGGGGYYSSGYRGSNPDNARWDGVNGGGGGNHYQIVPVKYGSETYSDLNYTISGGRGLQCIIGDTVYEFGHGHSAYPSVTDQDPVNRISHGCVIIIVYLKKEITL